MLLIPIVSSYKDVKRSKTHFKNLLTDKNAPLNFQWRCSPDLKQTHRHLHTTRGFQSSSKACGFNIFQKFQSVFFNSFFQKKQNWLCLEKKKKIAFPCFSSVGCTAPSFFVSDGQIFSWQQWKLATPLSHCWVPWEWREKQKTPQLLRDLLSFPLLILMKKH